MCLRLLADPDPEPTTPTGAWTRTLTWPDMSREVSMGGRVASSRGAPPSGPPDQCRERLRRRGRLAANSQTTRGPMRTQCRLRSSREDSWFRSTPMSAGVSVSSGLCPGGAGGQGLVRELTMGWLRGQSNVEREGAVRGRAWRCVAGTRGMHACMEEALFAWGQGAHAPHASKPYRHVQAPRGGRKRPPALRPVRGSGRRGGHGVCVRRLLLPHRKLLHLLHRGAGAGAIGGGGHDEGDSGGERRVRLMFAHLLLSSPAAPSWMTVGAIGHN